MGYWERRRDKKFKHLTESSGQVPLNKEELEKLEKARQYASDNRRRDLRKLIPIVIVSAVAAFFTRGLLTFLVNTETATIIMVASFFAAFLFMYVITVRTYMPPGVDFTVAGHIDPKNIHSMLILNDVHVPKGLISGINQDALNYPIMRDFGPSNLCDAFEWDPTMGEISVEPAWGANSEFEFITRHEVYHTTRDIAKAQARTINNYESYMDLEIELKAYEKAVELVDRIASSIFKPNDTKALMTELRNQIENDKKDLRVKIYGSSGQNTAPMENEAVTSGQQ
jgi:hypothetical protein